MLRIEDECVGCPQGCINCGRRHVTRLYCDECETEVSEPSDLRWFDGKQLCEKCILDKFEEVREEDFDHDYN